MSEDGPTSLTASSRPVRLGSPPRGPQQALEVVEQFRRSQISKAAALLAIQQALSADEGPLSTMELIQSLSTYFAMLDEIDSNRRADRTGPGRSQPSGPPAQLSQSLWPISPKRVRTSVREELFPWHSSASTMRAQLDPDVQSSLQLLEDWSVDPTFVQRKILLAPGCPDFPADQWLNIVKGQAVDLAKVLGAHYSTDLDNQQTQDLGDSSQPSVKVPKQTKAIRSHGDWVIAFGKTAQAIAYALPGRYSEYLGYQTYISSLFAAIQPAFHDRVIGLDKAIRRRAANQPHLRLIDFAQFEDLRTIHLTSFGMGSSATGSGPAAPRCRE